MNLFKWMSLSEIGFKVLLAYGLVRSVYLLVLFYKPEIRLYKEISGSIASRCLLYNCVHSSKSVDSC